MENNYSVTNDNGDYTLFTISIVRNLVKEVLFQTTDRNKAISDRAKYAKNYKQEIQSGKAKIVMEALICSYPFA